MKKTWAILDKGKIISYHIDFYNAQLAVIRKQEQRKISNDYEIIPISQLKKKDKEV